ncbi:MAG TPA: TIGR03557 family F420-dependent LLM class oxidoreductase [Rhizomicrobium sp.]|nr:TIGR03557 family F420-dependent LLM class oxidoreductase [Rhizomicrobium sp.]
MTIPHELFTAAPVPASVTNPWTGTGHEIVRSPLAAKRTTHHMSAVHSAGDGNLSGKILGYMLAHEQFPIPELAELANMATEAGFGLLATSDHFQPWQANEGHSGLAWVTMGALGERARSAWIGTTVTCPILRYHPAVVAEAFASLSQLYPGRVFLGVGSGEALNEQAATGEWPAWNERWERLAEAIEIIRKLWSGERVSHKGKHYEVDGRLYDPPARAIPLLTAANGPRAMRLAGKHGDGLVTDPMTWKQHKSEWERGAREAGKDPSGMPVLVEQFVVVGNEAQAEESAELWRFIPRAFKKYHDNPDPAEIQHQAEADLPLEKVYGGWTVGDDPAAHVNAIEELFESGATIVNIHSGQPDQKKVIDFYGKSVLPRLSKYLH